ncbi:MAG: hypothetical protein P1U58_13885 [Verrucomicrobiales bacterium]|nr:hypothetical protein [Verrucomicrobiales bacterium]
MIVEAVIITDLFQTYTGKRGKRSVRVLNCIERRRADQPALKSTFDFILSQLDEETHPNNLCDKHIILGITEVRPGFGGRPQLLGTIVKVK